MMAILKEVGWYFVFLWLLLLIAYGQSDTSFYYSNKSVADGLFKAKPYKLLSNYTMFWRWLNTTGLDLLYDRDSPHFLSTKTALLIGPPRLRQLRVIKGGCVHIDVPGTLHRCIREYTCDTEDRGNYGYSWEVTNVTSDVWRYHGDNQGTPTVGRHAVYGGGGYVANLGENRSDATATVDYLYTSKWIDEHTRAFFLEFTTYNANINLFSIITVIFETPEFGGITKSHVIESMRLYRYVVPFHVFVMACEVMYCAFVLYFTVITVRQIARTKSQYFTSIWNWVDVLLILISLAAVSVYIVRSVEVDYVMEQHKLHPGTFTSFYKASLYDSVLRYLLALLVLLGNMKLLNIIRFNPMMYMFTSTFRYSIYDIIMITIALLLFFLCYANLTFLRFHTSINSYRTYMTTYFSLFGHLMGYFPYEDISQLSRYAGPITLFSFVFITSFILLNALICIVLYALVIERKRHQPNKDDQLVDLMFERVREFLGLKHASKSALAVSDERASKVQ